MPEQKADLSSLTLPELRGFLATLGEPAYRGEQLFRWLHARGAASFAQMSDLPAALRTKLEETATLEALQLARRQDARDGTAKFLFTLSDGEQIESVLMQNHHGPSLCISSQVGCRMGCRFCASTIGGKVRDLSAGELIGQLHAAERISGAAVDSIVMMGIGEPLDNYDNTLRFLRLLSDPKGRGMSLRHLSLSSCGLCEEIDRLAEERLGVTLSVSLHAATDERRNELMPVNRRYPLARLMESCRRYFEKTGRRISYEYALIAGVNDRAEDADALQRLLRGQNCHINLIRLNPVRERGFKRPDDPRRFAAELADRGLTVTLRRELGGDIEAACGQLRRSAALEAASDKEGSQ